MKQDDGTLYVRPPEIEGALEVLYQLPQGEIERRAVISDPSDPEYIASECLLHFLRQSKANGDSQFYKTHFVALRERICRAVQVRTVRVKGTLKTYDSSRDAAVQTQVLDKFLELLCIDRHGYDERLDFWEVKFNKALLTLELTAGRKVGRDIKRNKPLTADEETLEVSGEVEEALRRFKLPNGEKNDDFLFRNRCADAIRALPPEEMQVVELVLQDDFPISSEDPEAMTMAKVLKCNERTVRNRRDRAFKKLAKVLKEEEVL